MLRNVEFTTAHSPIVSLLSGPLSLSLSLLSQSLCSTPAVMIDRPCWVWASRLVAFVLIVQGVAPFAFSAVHASDGRPPRTSAGADNVAHSRAVDAADEHRPHHLHHHRHHRGDAAERSSSGDATAGRGGSLDTGRAGPDAAAHHHHRRGHEAEPQGATGNDPAKEGGQAARPLSEGARHYLQKIREGIVSAKQKALDEAKPGSSAAAKARSSRLGHRELTGGAPQTNDGGDINNSDGNRTDLVPFSGKQIENYVTDVAVFELYVNKEAFSLGNVTIGLLGGLEPAIVADFLKWLPSPGGGVSGAVSSVDSDGSAVAKPPELAAVRRDGVASAAQPPPRSCAYKGSLVTRIVPDSHIQLGALPVGAAEKASFPGSSRAFYTADDVAQVLSDDRAHLSAINQMLKKNARATYLRHDASQLFAFHNKSLKLKFHRGAVATVFEKPGTADATVTATAANRPPRFARQFMVGTSQNKRIKEHTRRWYDNHTVFGHVLHGFHSVLMHLERHSAVEIKGGLYQPVNSIYVKDCWRLTLEEANEAQRKREAQSVALAQELNRKKANAIKLRREGDNGTRGDAFRPNANASEAAAAYAADSGDATLQKSVLQDAVQARLAREAATKQLKRRRLAADAAADGRELDTNGIQPKGAAKKIIEVAKRIAANKSATNTSSESAVENSEGSLGSRRRRKLDRASVRHADRRRRPRKDDSRGGVASVSIGLDDIGGPLLDVEQAMKRQRGGRHRGRPSREPSTKEEENENKGADGQGGFRKRGAKLRRPASSDS